MCTQFGYDGHAAIPGFAGFRHPAEGTAKLQIIAGINHATHCYKHALLFGCTALIPRCYNPGQFPVKTIPPCRSLCISKFGKYLFGINHVCLRLNNLCPIMSTQKRRNLGKNYNKNTIRIQHSNICLYDKDGMFNGYFYEQHICYHSAFAESQIIGIIFCFRFHFQKKYSTLETNPRSSIKSDTENVSLSSMVLYMYLGYL